MELAAFFFILCRAVAHRAVAPVTAFILLFCKTYKASLEKRLWKTDGSNHEKNKTKTAVKMINMIL
jgi:hypothetical protein